MIAIRPGMKIIVRHLCRGTFTMLVEKVKDTAVTGKITQGLATYLTSPDCLPGDSITIYTDSPLVQISYETEEPDAGQ